MLDMMARNWWMLLIRGIAAVVLGVALLVWPGLTLDILVIVFAVYLIVDGIFALATALMHRSYERWWLLALEGVLGLLAGIAAFLYPGAAVVTFFYIVAFWAIATGVMEIISAIALRKEIDNEWWLIIGGAVSILWGVLLVVYPGAGILTILWLFSAAAIVFGVMLILLSFRVRRMTSSSSGGMATAAKA